MVLLLGAVTACGAPARSSAPASTTAPGTAPPSTATPTTTASAPAGRSHVFNVVSFGADPSGATDSTQAIRRAIAAATAGTTTSTVYFPAGRYLLDLPDGRGTDLPIVSTHPVEVQGAGMADTTVVEKVGTIAYPNLKRGKNVFSLDADGSTFTGLTVDAQTYNAGNTLDDNADNTTIEDSRFLLLELT
jgi:hypothetical protein